MLRWYGSTTHLRKQHGNRSRTCGQSTPTFLLRKVRVPMIFEFGDEFFLRGDRVMPVTGNSYSRASESNRRSVWHSPKASETVNFINGLNMRVVAPGISVPTQVESLDSDLPPESYEFLCGIADNGPQVTLFGSRFGIVNYRIGSRA